MARRAGDSLIPSVRTAASEALSLLDGVLTETERRTLARNLRAAIDAAELRQGKARIPGVAYTPPNPWRYAAESKQTALMAARASRLLRFNPVGLVAEELVRLGYQSLAEQLLADRSLRNPENEAWTRQGGLFMPVPGGLVLGEGWVETTDAELVPYPEADPYGPSVRWWAGVQTQVPTYGEYGTPWSGYVQISLPVEGNPGGGNNPGANRWVAASSTGTSEFSLENGDPDIYVEPGTRSFRFSGSSTGSYITEEEDRVAPISAPIRFPDGPGWKGAAERNRQVAKALAKAAKDVTASFFPYVREAGYAVRQAAVISGQMALTGKKPPEYQQVINTGARGNEIKLKMPGKKSAVYWLANFASEAKDAIMAVWWALPKPVRDAYRQRWVEQEFAKGVRFPNRVPPIDYIYDTLKKERAMIDSLGAVRELAWEAIEDRIYGRLGRVTGDALRFQKSEVGTASPGYDHALSPQLPLDRLQAMVTGREARDAASLTQPRVQAFMVAERSRRRAQWRAEAARRAAYRQRWGRTQLRMRPKGTI